MTPREYLFSLIRYGVKLGLDNIEHLVESCGNPHLACPVVHVAGTNGKGSVLAVLDSILRCSGLSTGRFTSPHLLDVSERFLVKGRLPDDACLDSIIDSIRDVSEKMEPSPTFFEFCTAIAFCRFAQAGVDMALIEVGMGGRFDATNVVSPQVCAISTIGLEHTKFLGDTLEKIAFEKAGIIKPGVPLVVGETNPGPRDVIMARARELDCPVLCLGEDFNYRLEGTPFSQQFSYESGGMIFGPVPLSLAGRFQGQNAAVAVAVAEVVGKDNALIDGDSIVAGLGNAKWPCRFEKVLDDPPVIMDAAHNPNGISKLVGECGDCVAIFAVSSDKDATEMLEELSRVADPLILSRFEGSRAMPVDALRAVSSAVHIESESLEDAIAQGLKLASETRPLLITGSVYTCGEARAILSNSYGATPLAF